MEKEVKLVGGPFDGRRVKFYDNGYADHVCMTLDSMNRATYHYTNTFDGDVEVWEAVDG